MRSTKRGAPAPPGMPRRWPIVNAWVPSCWPIARAGRVVDDRRRPRPRRRALEEPDVVAVGDEADLLRVGLVGVGQAEPARQRAHLVLAHVAERKPARATAARAARRTGSTTGPCRDRAPRRSTQAAVRRRARCARSARSRARRADRVGEREQRPELEPLVAAHAGVRRPARAVFGHELVDHPALKRRALVDHVVRDARAAPPSRARPRCRAARSNARRCWRRSRSRRRAATSRRSPRTPAPPATPPPPTNPRPPTSRRPLRFPALTLTRRDVGSGRDAAPHPRHDLPDHLRHPIDLRLRVPRPDSEPDRTPRLRRATSRAPATPPTAPASPTCTPRPVDTLIPSRSSAAATNCPGAPANPTLSVPGNRSPTRRRAAARPASPAAAPPADRAGRQLRAAASTARPRPAARRRRSRRCRSRSPCRRGARAPGARRRRAARTARPDAG